MFSRAAFYLTTAAVVASAAACWAGCSSTSSPSVGSGTDAGTGSSSSSGSSSGAGSSSGGSSGGGSGGSSGGSSGSSSGSSSGGASDAGPTCPTVPCPGSGTCCANLATDVPVCTPTCAADDTIACLGAAGCSGATPDCCATDVLDGMDAGESFPHCHTASLTTKCGTCASSIQLSCTATQLLHVCQAASECADDTANPNCCVVAGYHVCVNSELKLLGSLSCL